MSLSSDLTQLLHQAAALFSQGTPAAALPLLDTILTASPDHPDSLHLKALILAETEKLSEATDILERLTATHPQSVEFRGNFMRILHRQKQWKKLADTAQSCLANPDSSADFLALAGQLLTDGDHPEHALPLLQTAFAKGDRRPSTILSLCKIFRLTQDWGNLASACEQISHLDVSAEIRRLCFLDMVTASVELGCYDRFADAHLNDALEHRSLSALAAAITHAKRYARFDGPEMLSRMERATALFPSPEPAPEIPNPDPERRLRIGIMGPFIGSNLTAYQIDWQILKLDREHFDPIIIAGELRDSDDLTPYGDIPVIALNNLSLDQAVATLQEQRLDILVDWGVHTNGIYSWLGNFRIAPVQIALYFSTSGLTQIDALMTDPYIGPDRDSGRRRYYSEPELISHPGGFSPWSPPADIQIPLTEPPCLTSGQITFGSFNALPKLTDETLALWGQVLKTVPNSRMLVKNAGLTKPSMQDYFRKRLIRAGADPERFLLIGSTVFSDHLKLFSKVDIALDCMPYNGALTTGEMLFQGIPVISLVGKMAYARMGLLYLSMVEHAEFATPSKDEYVALAQRLANNPEQLKTLRSTLRDRLLASPMAELDGYMDLWQQQIRELWQRACSKQSQR